jgi:hypothetical protein
MRAAACTVIASVALPSATPAEVLPAVIPAEAGIQCFLGCVQGTLDSRLRGNDGEQLDLQ